MSLNHKGTVMLETERLILRRYTLDDVTDAYNNYFSDPDVAMYMQWDAHTNISQTEEWVSRFISNYEKPDFYRWAITQKCDNQAIGAIGFHIEKEYDEVADVAYNVGKAFWNRGIVTEALKAVLRFAFVDVGLNRVEAFHSVNNPASGKVMAKAGMTLEGHSRAKYRSHMGFEDCDLYGIIKTDYFKREGSL